MEMHNKNEERKRTLPNDRNVETVSSGIENLSEVKDKTNVKDKCIGYIMKGLFSSGQGEKAEIELKETERLLNKESGEEENKINVRDKIKGVFIGFFMTFVVGASVVSVPMLQRKIPDFELNFIRSVISWILISFGLLFTKQLPRIEKSEIIWLLLYSINTVITTICMYTSVSMIPLSYYKSLYFTVTILTGLVLFPLFLGEKTQLKSILFGLICIVGLILSIQPEFIFTWKNKLWKTDLDNTILYNCTGNSSGNATMVGNENHHFIWPGGLTTLGCILAALAGTADNVFIIILKKRPYFQQNVMPVLFWVLGFSTVACFMIMMIFEKPVIPQTFKQYLLIAIHSFSFITGWTAHMVASRYISGNTINIIYSTLVVLMLIPQYTILKHILPGNKNWIEVLGGILVFSGAIAGTFMDIIKEN